MQGAAALERYFESNEWDPEQFTPADHAALEGEWSWLANVAQLGTASGPGGMIDDNIAYVRPWGFDLQQVRGPVLLLHGGQDRVAPSSHARWLVSRLRSAELWLSPDDGHISVLSSAVPHVAELLDGIFADTKSGPPADLLAQLLNLAITSRDQATAAKALEQLGKPSEDKYAPWQMATTGAFLDALERRGSGLEELQASASARLKEALEKLGGLLDYARKTSETAAASEGDRLLAIRLLGRGPASQTEDVSRLGEILRPQFSAPVQQAALDRLKQINNPQVGETLLTGWKNYGPSLRTEVLSALLSRLEWVRDLLGAIQSGRIAAAEVSPVHQQRLLRHSEEKIRQQAGKLFAARNPDRQKLIENYAVVNHLTGNAERGAALYRQNCLACHQLKGEGNSVGPDLGTVADKPVETLLVAILDPNQAFETRYINYTAVTKSGRELSGIIAAETPNSITLRNSGGADEVILRSDLKELTSSKLSLMPEGLETILKPQDMTDLIAYIRSK